MVLQWDDYYRLNILERHCNEIEQNGTMQNGKGVILVYLYHSISLFPVHTSDIPTLILFHSGV